MPSAPKRTVGEAPAANRLAKERSPYLLQHAHNPVEWWPWCDEAFETARRLDRPVFVSIGYSTCHWCHVMERESFEDAGVAAVLNGAFVNVKVDREERPDVDAVYMAVCQMVTGAGGWPLTIVMTPDRKPFFAATYVPKDDRWGRPGLLTLVPQIQRAWREGRDEVLRSADDITGALQRPAMPGPPRGGDANALELAYTQLSQSFDADAGGFGRAPKFPSPHQLTFLLRDWRRTGNKESLWMVERTLDAMRAGGVWDHVGFGFHRYATDRHWLVPHFEKMLYDQALLLLAYTEAYQATGQARHAATARQIATYVLRELRSPEGAFHSAEDADSEGVEGKYYVWTEDGLRAAVGAADAELAARAFGVTRDGNFHDEATGQRTGANILHEAEAPARLAARLGTPETDLRARLERARSRLLEARSRRVRPALDDKVLADWNGLMIAALARTGRALDEPALVAAAGRAADFVLTRLGTRGGRLLHRYRDGEAAIPAFLDDHAFLAWGLLELYEATFDARRLQDALAHADELVRRFADEPAGGFFLTAPDATDALVRHKGGHDGAVPSGNSVAALVLLRLARMTGRTDLEARASGVVTAFSGDIDRSPAAHTFMLHAICLAEGPAQEVVIAGRRGAHDTEALAGAARRVYAPDAVLLLRDPTDTKDPVASLAPFSKSMGLVDGHAAAYVCKDHACQRPVTTPEALVRALGG